MKHVLAFLVLAASAYALFAERPATADSGSCYSPRPICISGRPVCLCDYALNCYWGCR